MKLLPLAAATMFAMCAVQNAAAMQPHDAPAPTDQATINHTRSFDFVSKVNGESYRVKVYVPQGVPPADGYPALYVLDGSVLFSTFAAAVWNQGTVKERAQAVVVGIESGPGNHGADRTFDFTPSGISDVEKKVVVDLGSNPKFGGYEAFIETIQNEIKPRVRAIVPVDPRHETLLGWSLGGQVAVHTMLVHPDDFTCYVALSPSLWFADRAVFKEIPAFEKEVAGGGKRVSLFVGVGALEEQVSPGMAQWPVDQTRLAAEMKYDRMVGNVRDFTSEIQPFFEKQGMAFESRIFDGETHNSVPWSAVNPVLTFVLPIEHPK